MPASSPSRKSNSLTSYPLSWAHLVYILYNICVQSCDSVPPAPGWSVIIALLVSYFPESNVFISKLVISPSIFAVFFINSLASSSSDSSFNKSLKSFKLSNSDFKLLYFSIFDFMLDISLKTLELFLLSVQKDSSRVFFSKKINRCFNISMSKWIT